MRSRVLSSANAMSADGRSFSPRQRIPTVGLAHHPRIVAGADGSLTIAWDERSKGFTSVALAHVVKGGARQPTFAREVFTTQTPSIYPALAATSDGVVAVWTSGQAAAASIQVARIGQAGGTR
jgi:hypothetical protein